MRVVVLGAGYVGLELCRRLTPDHDVTGVRRSDAGIAAIEATGASAVRADVTDDTELSAVPDCDVLVFAASSGGRGADAAREVYVDGLRTAIEHFAERPSPPDRLVYTSSTSVYGDHNGAWVDEATPLDPQTEKTEVLVEAERVTREEAPEHGLDGTVVRFAGLYGPDRYRLERYVEGPVTQGYLNMLHRDDAAGIVAFVVDTDPDDEVVLAVDDEPVDRWSLADWLAEECGVDLPEKLTVEERLAEADLSTAAERRLRTSKRCSNDRLHELGYEFAYPTYREGYRAAIEAYRSALDESA